MISRYINDDVAIGIHAVCIELFGEDTPTIRKRVYRMRSEVQPDKRLPGWRKVGGKIALVRTLARQAILAEAK